MTPTPGTLVRYRARDWIVLPSPDDDALLSLRPIGGGERETTRVLEPLVKEIGYELEYERVKSSTFPLPDPSTSRDHVAVGLLQEAARLLLRDGAAPFGSLGHISFRPRAYQFVPLLMALRLDTVRLLIADDVGVGKTLEGGLVARELLDRGRARRLAVLCPAYLCDQWHKELQEKLNIDSVVVRSGTISRLERDVRTPDRSIFEWYPHLVLSIDTVKLERYKGQFLAHCPDLVIVDEAHGAARPRSEGRGGKRQLRHALVRELADDPSRHLLLLTATPHSGIEESFLSLLGLLRKEFEQLDLDHMAEREEKRLAKHFVQRRRRDLMLWMNEKTPFPERDEEDVEHPYELSAPYMDLFRNVHDFARDIVTTADTLQGGRRRMRYWSALALLRCVTSSPAAAQTALKKRMARDEDDLEALSMADADPSEIDEAFSPLVTDDVDTENVVDTSPRAVFKAQERFPDWRSEEQRQLYRFYRQAGALRGEEDTKLQEAIAVVDDMLRDGYQPIVWCRFIATAEYVAEGLREALADEYRGLRVAAVTGTMAEDDRRLQVEELGEARKRVLVATGCLSEGINLQEWFDAVVHYDLPWNPNRLEQREGRVDRFGQTAERVRVVMLYGHNNPIDGAVLEVLLRKARAIRRDLGIHVPVPVNSDVVLETVLRSLFNRGLENRQQLSLWHMPKDAQRLVEDFQQAQEEAARREEQRRSRFSQHGIKPREVVHQLEKVDAVLGRPADVRRFLLEASQSVGFQLEEAAGQGWRLEVNSLPGPIQARVSAHLPRRLREASGESPRDWPITFHSPTPQGYTYVGRNHPLVEALAEHLFDLAFHPLTGDERVSRCGVIRTESVDTWTTLYLARLRYLQHEEDTPAPTMAEETLVWGVEGLPPDIKPLEPGEARHLLAQAVPVANVPATEKEEVLEQALDDWRALEERFRRVVGERAEELATSHARVREAIGQEPVRVEPKGPPDLLGMAVLLPVPQGVSVA